MPVSRDRRREELVPYDPGVARRLNADPHSVPANAQHLDENPIVDPKAFLDLPLENQHPASPLFFGGRSGAV